MVAINNLFGYFRYPSKKSDLPIVILMHGWSSDAITGIGFVTTERIANLGFFVAVPGMRGRNSATGARDASARELHDIYDLITYIRTNYSSVVSPTKAIVVGYSGGGGNAIGCACKFPDTFSAVVSFFGMSDYGRDGTNGWYANNGGTYTTQIATAVGDTPANVPNNYYARDATSAITNYSGGKIILFHDKGDATVPYVHSTRIKTALDNTGLTNYLYNVSEITDGTRWLHANPGEIVDEMILAEAIWSPIAASQAAWTIPASGTITVIGYIVTKRFTIWLNSGLDAAATVVYDTAAGAYTVTPLTSAHIDVVVTQGALTASAHVESETTLTVA